MSKFGNYLLITLVFATISFCSISELSLFNRSEASIKTPGLNIPVENFVSGDIVLREGKSFVSHALRSFSQTDKHYSHAGMIVIRNGEFYVCHVMAAEGKRSDKIRLEPLASFCNKADNSSIAVYRSGVDPLKIDSVMMDYFAKGISFDNDFDLNSDQQMYCTELVYKVLTAANGNEKFINLSHGNGIDYVACDNLYLNPQTRLIYSYNY
jgi:hypothetical protein